MSIKDEDQKPKPSKIIRPDPPASTAAAEPEQDPAKGLSYDDPVRHCDSCQHGFFNNPNMLSGQCRQAPPKPYVFLFPPKLQGGPIEKENITAWPVVYRTQFCGAFAQTEHTDESKRKMI